MRDPRGTWRLLRRSYADELSLIQAIHDARRRGADVERDLADLCSVYVGTGSCQRQLTATEAIRLAFPRPDISPRHKEDRSPDQGEEEFAPEPGREDERRTFPCKAGCGEAVPMEGMKCVECAAEAARAWKAGRQR